MKALALVALLAGSVSAETAAVLSSESKPYREALDGLREALGPSAPPALASLDESPAVETVVAFGARAAGARHENARTLVVALAPAHVADGRASACVITISAMPSPEALIATLRRLQPGLHKLWVAWISPAFGPYMKSLVEAGKAAGVSVDVVHMASAAELPDRLRAAEFESGAVFVPPDPELVSRATFDILEQAAVSRKIPIYAPFPNLLAEGATASVGVSFREMGRSAGLVAQRARQKLRCDSVEYPERVQVHVDLSAARAAGLSGDAGTYAGFAETVP